MRGLGWNQIIRLGLVQASIGAIVMLTTSLLNRVMVVEYALVAAIPAGLVAWHYGVQLSRPLWGHGSDKGGSRTPWIRGGMAMLALGALLAVNATVLMGKQPVWGGIMAIVAFSMIGIGVGAAGTSLLALLASRVDPGRRAAAAAVTWIMMVAGIVVAAASVGSLIDPFSPRRLALVAGGAVFVALLLSWSAITGIERKSMPIRAPAAPGESPDFMVALREMLDDREARRFTIFVFVSMLAYSMQDLILEPFAGLVFGMTPGESTRLAGMQHGGVLVGMIVAGIGGSAFFGRRPSDLRSWIVGGCLGSALALAGLASAAVSGANWPLAPNVFALGFANGIFAVAAIGAMMGLAGKGDKSREGIRMGVWGASQAMAFGLGGLMGAVGLDVSRQIIGADPSAFQFIFALEGALFLVAAALAVQATATRPVKEARHAL